MMLLALTLAEVGTFDGLDAYDVVWAALAVVTIGAAAGGLHRWIWQPGCQRMRKFDAIYDLLAGASPVVDPVTGVELRPLVQPLGLRLAAVEQKQQSQDETVASLAAAEASRAEADVLREQTQAQLAEVADKLAEHEVWQREHAEGVDATHSQIWAAIATLGGTQRPT